MKSVKAGLKNILMSLGLITLAYATFVSSYKMDNSIDAQALVRLICLAAGAGSFVFLTKAVRTIFKLGDLKKPPKKQ